MSLLHDRNRQPRVWNERLALSLRELESGAQALAERTALLAERLDTHTRRLGLPPVQVMQIGYSRSRRKPQ
jgi:hypothetical protein